MNQKKKQLVKKLANKEYRHAWTSESIKMALPFQIQANREKRDWSQAILGIKSEMKQNAISRLESMDYGNLTVNTLLRLSYAFDCGLLVKFVPFSRLVTEFEDVSNEALLVESFDNDQANLDRWTENSPLTVETPVRASTTDNADFTRVFNAIGKEDVIVYGVIDETPARYEPLPRRRPLSSGLGTY